MIPNEVPVENCILEVQVIDHDTMSQGDLLGVRIISGEELVNLLQLTPPPWMAHDLSYQPPSNAVLTEFWKSRGCELITGQKSVYFPLESAAQVPTDLDQIAQVKGDVEVKVTFIDPFHHYSPPSATSDLIKSKEKESKSSNFHMPTKRGQFHHQDIAMEVLSQEVNASLWEKELIESVGSKLERELGELPAMSLMLTVHAAKGLANADTFGKSDPFVRIWWNGRFVGMTSTIDDSLDPIWNEEFELPVAMGQQVESCFMELEVYDRDGAKEGEFLGMLYLSGSKLQELMNEYVSAAALSFSSNTSGLVVKSYPLKPSAYHSDKENMLAKGNIQLSIKPIYSQDGNKWNTSADLDALQSNDDVHTSDSYEIPIEEPSSQSVKIFYNLEFFLSNVMLIDKNNIPNLEMMQKKEHDDNYPILAKIWLNGCDWYTARGKYDTESHAVKWRLSAFAETTHDTGKSSKRKQQQDQTAAIGHFVFRIPSKLNIEDNFLQVTFFYQPTSSSELQAVERASAYFLGGILLTGKILNSFMKFPDVIEDYHYNKKYWHRVGILPLLSIPITTEIVSKHEKPKLLEDFTHIAKEYLVKAKVESALKIAKLISKADVIWLGAETSRYQRIKELRSKCLRIASKLGEEQMNWCYDYELDMQLTDEWRKAQMKDEEEEGNQMKALPKTSSYRDPNNPRQESNDQALKSNVRLPTFTSNPLLNKRQKREGTPDLSEIDRSKSSKNLINDRKREAPNPSSAPTTTAIEATQDPQANAEELDTNPVLDIPRFKLELAAINFTVTIKGKFEEDYRVYWRGKVTPKNVTFANEDMKKMVFASRSSRLLRNKNINELEVMSEVHYVKEFGDEIVNKAEKQASLPVCVKEVLNSGPGLVQRTFRIEMITNTNILLGTTEIADNVLDFYRVVGSDAIEKIIHRNQNRLLSEKEWDYTTIFEYIVQDRLDLNMLTATPPPPPDDPPPESPSTKKGSSSTTPATAPSAALDAAVAPGRKRKKAVFVANPAGHSGDLSAGSVIRVRRDEEELVRNFDETFMANFQPIHEEEEEEREEEGKEEEKTSEHGAGKSTTDDQSQSVHSGNQGYESASESAPSDSEGVESSSKKDRKKKKSKKAKMPKQQHVLRIYSRSHRLTGKMFRSIVLFTSETEAALAEHPDFYFRTMYPEFRSCQSEYNSDMKLLFRCQDCVTKKLYTIEMPASALWDAEWLPGEFNYPDLSTKFRREKLGSRLMSYVGLRFLSKGDFCVEFNIDNHMNSKRMTNEELAQPQNNEEGDENEEEDAEESDAEGEEKKGGDVAESEEDADDYFFNNIDESDDDNDDEDDENNGINNDGEDIAQSNKEANADGEPPSSQNEESAPSLEEKVE